MSPVLFNAVMHWVVQSCEYRGIQLSEKLWLWYIAYADDIVLFGEMKRRHN
jgi:hypothetical protein